MNEHTNDRLHQFLSLGWYEEAIKFVFNFITKTSELLLAAGVVISTANFLTDGGVMTHNPALSDAWSWAQALAIDSSLGIVLMDAFQALREREKIKAIIFFTLTALLAVVAGLITHFDALGHATGLPVTDKSISGILPLWIMTALRAIAVIGFLLTSRLKHFSFNELRQQRTASPSSTQTMATPSIDYAILAMTLVETLQRNGTVQVQEDCVTSLSFSSANNDQEQLSSQKAVPEGDAQARIASSYEHLCIERAQQQDDKPISARDLAKRANVRRSTCSEWLQRHKDQPDKPDHSGYEVKLPVI